VLILYWRLVTAIRNNIARGAGLTVTAQGEGGGRGGGAQIRRKLPGGVKDGRRGTADVCFESGNIEDGAADLCFEIGNIEGEGNHNLDK
jgi:hypothetical protein